MARPKVHPEIKRLRAWNRYELETLLNEILHLPYPALRKIAESDEVYSITKLLARMLVRGIVESDYGGLQFILERLYGKPKTVLDVKTDKPFIVQLATGEHIAMGIKQGKQEQIEARDVTETTETGQESIPSVEAVSEDQETETEA